MNRMRFLCGSASALIIGALAPLAAHAASPVYAAGDFHNHTTCQDGSVAVQTLIDKAVGTYNLDWFVNSGHGGEGTRDCRFDDPENDGPKTGSGKLWVDTIGAAALKGDPVLDSSYTTDGVPVRAMWQWQSIQEYNYPTNIANAAIYGRTILEGVEENVPGHEHSSTSIIAGQYPFSGAAGNADAVAQFEYLFDRNDKDFSKGPNGTWQGKIPSLVGLAGHTKSVAAVAWQQQKYGAQAWNLPAHLERQGAFDPNGTKGYNIDQLRDYNNAGPTVAFGMESEPGHQAESNRGSYNPSVAFGGTMGGVGIYAAQINNIWDAMLAEGRNWFFFASSDYHNRGIFGPNDSSTTADFWPGEFQKDYIPVAPGKKPTPQAIVAGLRSGNSYSVMGDLIGNDMQFSACSSSGCAGMGGTLVVAPGEKVTFRMAVTDPDTPNLSPYGFPNPELLQVGITQPLNSPVLDHVDFIKGDVTGPIAYGSAGYTSTANANAALYASFDASNWKAVGTRRTMTFIVPNVQSSFYVRARGTNLAQGTPNATDEIGNPLFDTNANNILCTDAACPSHLPVNVNGQPFVDVDVEAWSNLWFYANPIFVRVSSQPTLLVERNSGKAAALEAKLAK